jgi:hypothetical protein
MADPKSAALPLGYSPKGNPDRSRAGSKLTPSDANGDNSLWRPRRAAAREGGRLTASPVGCLDLEVDPGDVKPHAARSAAGGAAATAAPPAGVEPADAGRAAPLQVAIGSALRGALIVHWADHTARLPTAGDRKEPARRARRLLRLHSLPGRSFEAGPGSPYTPAEMADPLGSTPRLPARRHTPL